MDKVVLRAYKKFEQLDVNSNGLLEGDELSGLATWVWSSFHPGGQPVSAEFMEQEGAKLLGRLDANGDGAMSFDEFAEWFRRTCESVAQYRRGLSIRKKQVVKKSVGRNIPMDGASDINEAVTKEESDRFFDLYDTNGSGTVEMQELLEMVAAFKQRESSSLNQAKIKEAWDADGDGTVSLLAAM